MRRTPPLLDQVNAMPEPAVVARQPAPVPRVSRLPHLTATRGLWLDLALVLLLLVAALPFRLVNLDTAAPKSDEGIRLGQLYLMSTGFRPIRDIFASQGPLSLDVTYPLFALFGQSLGAARLAVVVYSLGLLVAVYLLARQIAGRWAGLLAGLLLVLSPVYLKNSRTALVEVPALLPATLAVWSALRYQAAGRRAWLISSALLLATALLIKPLLLPAAVGVLFALLGPRADRRRSLGLAALVGGGLMTVVVVLYGPTELYDQVIRYRVGSAEAEGWSLAENMDLIWDELASESLAWLALGAFSLPVSIVLLGRAVLPVAAWLLASLALLLVYTPLAPKHVVILLPPAATLVACGLAALAWSALSPRERAAVGGGGPRRPLWMVRGALLAGATALLLWYLTSVPGVLGRDRQVATAGTQGRDDPFADEVALLGSLTAPNDFILVDEPYLAYLSHRRVPPSLIDPTVFRLRSGTLSGGEVVAAAVQHDVQAMLLWSDGLRDLKKFGEWLDANYRQVKIYERRNGKDRALYLRNDADFIAARRVLRGSLSAASAEFGEQLRLAAAGVEQADVRAGSALLIATEWETIAPLSVDYHVLAILRGPTGSSVAQIERALGGGGAGTSFWEPGRWSVRTFYLTVPPRTPAGDYTLALGLYDSKARRVLPVSAGAAGPDADDVSVAAIRVR